MSSRALPEDEALKVSELPFDLSCVRAEAAKITDPRKRLKFVRDFLLSIPEDNFNMAEWARAPGPGVERRSQKPACGTVACIGGWTSLLFPDSAANALGLRREQASDLFYPRMCFKPWHMITNAEAARVSDHFLETNVVDWTII